MKTAQQMRAEISEAIARAYTNADPDWFAEMVVCLYDTATERMLFQIDDVWRMFERRGSGLSTHNRMAAGAVMRLGIKNGWILREERPRDLVTERNHNAAGTGYWRSTIFAGGESFPDTLLRFYIREPEQADLFAEGGS